MRFFEVGYDANRFGRWRFLLIGGQIAGCYWTTDKDKVSGKSQRRDRYYRRMARRGVLRPARRVDF